MERHEQLQLFNDAPYHIGRVVLPTALEILHYGEAEHDNFIDDIPLTCAYEEYDEA